MTYYFAGYQMLDFKTDKGDIIDGVNIFLLSRDENVKGQRAEKKFISRQFLDKMRVNFDTLIDKHVQILCDLKGHPVLIQEVEKKA